MLQTMARASHDILTSIIVHGGTQQLLDLVRAEMHKVKHTWSSKIVVTSNMGHTLASDTQACIVFALCLLLGLRMCLSCPCHAGHQACSICPAWGWCICSRTLHQRGVGGRGVVAMHYLAQSQPISPLWSSLLGFGA